MIVKVKIQDNILCRCLLGLVAGFFIFLILYSSYPLNTNNLTWIYTNKGDLFQHQIGWTFFRQANWMFPLGCFDTYPYQFLNSVVYTDSIPWFAIIFKLMRDFLPEHFQYMGLFTCLCFGMQGMFALLIMRKLKISLLPSIASLPLFFFNFVLLFRVFYHTSLAGGQCLILASIYIWLYKDSLSVGRKILYWSILGGIAVGIHPYFVPMIGIVMLSDVIYSLIFRRQWGSVLILGMSLSVVFLCFYILGGFSLPLGRGHVNDLGVHSMNLNALFNSFNYSYFIKELPHGIKQYEGINYLGVAVIFLFILSIFFPIKTNKKKIVIYIFTLIIPFSLLALSPVVMWGDKIVLDYTFLLPKSMINIWSIYRSTGRLFWPLYYLLLIYVIYATYNMKFFAKKITLLFGLCSIITYIEVGPGVIKRFNELQMPISMDLNKELTRTVNEKVKHVVLITRNVEQFYKPVTIFAAEKHITMNNGHFARYPNPSNDLHIESLATGNLDPTSIYIIPQQELKNIKILNTDQIEQRQMDIFHVVFDKNLLKN